MECDWAILRYTKVRSVVSAVYHARICTFRPWSTGLKQHDNIGRG